MTKFHENDTVVIALTCKARDGSIHRLNTQATMRELGMNNQGKRQADAPVFDVETFRALLVKNTKADTDRALAMQADFAHRTAEYVATNGATPVDNLAQSVVDWVINSRPGGKVFTNNPKDEGFVISTNEIAIAGPFGDVDGERLYRVTAVGTWGS